MAIDTGDLTTRELLIRVVTRQDQMREAIIEMRREGANARQLHASKSDLERLEKNIAALVEKVDGLSKHYVTQAEFYPIKRIVYGAVGLILVAVVSALIGLVII